jgi:hypothetical protein
MKTDSLHKLDDFFRAYEKRFNDFLSGKELDMEGTVKSFAKFFVGASPLGVNGGANDDNFRPFIEKGYAFYKSIGTRAMKIVGSDITLLDDFHAMAKIHWRAVYDKKGKEVVIDFDVIYFVQILNNEMKIFAYITGDEQKALKENGLV